MDAALKRSRLEEPAEFVPSARDAEAAVEEGMEQGLEEEEEEEEEEEVDPRIQGELEKLNQSTDDINRRETELEREYQRPARCRIVRWISAASSSLRVPLALLEQHPIPFAL
ncbi:hypothetical protein MC885_009163 [Smutsia gigantea]|nr:hypothetical protein MC885_009163 [Smutsia gigantea]